MAQTNKEVTEDFLQSFADAFNSHDVKAIMSHMTDDCVFEASSGPYVNGEKFTGQKKVKHAFENVFAMFPDGIMPCILFQAAEVFPNGFLLELNQMVPGLKLQDAIYLHLRMVK